METLIEIWSLVRNHLAIVGLMFTWAGIGIVYFRKRSDWLRKSFLNQVNFSLNYVEDGKLCLRTLMELSATEVWLNDFGIKKVFKAAARTEASQPFILLDDEEDMEFVRRAVLNVLSEKFADAFLARSMNVPTRTARYCFALTYENFADMRTRKLRVLLVESESLKNQFGPASRNLGVDEPRHRDRLSVLHMMHDIHLGNKSVPKPVLGEVELGLVA